MTRGTSKSEAKGIQSVEIGYRVLLAVQRGPGVVQLSEIAKRSGLSMAATHNYLTSLLRTGLVKQEGRGAYRLGPSAFALSLASFQELDGYEVMKAEAQALHDRFGVSTAVSVWSEGGPVSVFIQRAPQLSALDIRPGLVPMLTSAVGMVFMAHLADAQTSDLIDAEMASGGADGSIALIHEARRSVFERGYAYYRRAEDGYYALAVPVWHDGSRISFVLTIIDRDPAYDPEQDRTYIDALIASANRAALLLGHNPAMGPQGVNGPL